MKRILAETLLRVGLVIILCIAVGMVAGCVPVDWGVPVSPATGNVGETAVGVGLTIFLVSLWFWKAKYDK